MVSSLSLVVLLVVLVVVLPWTGVSNDAVT